MKKKILFLSVMILLVSVLCACGEQKKSEANTLGTKYQAVFEETKESSSAKVADELIALGAMDAELVSMEVEPGYLNGFDNEIRGFSKGTMFSPMIGSIPFVGYVFETDDPTALIDELTKNANMAWNVCTQADEMVYTKKGNLVFFMMCSNEE